MRTAVAAMRAEIDGIIAEEAARLLGEGPGRIPPGVGGAIFDGSPARPTLATRPELPPTPLPGSDPAPSRGPRAETIRDEDAEDADRRLDALASRLEGRLRRARDRAADRPEGPDPSRGTSPSRGE